MRPRHKTAENAIIDELLRVLVVASMRPRHKTAENLTFDGFTYQGNAASMRPRHKTAENAEREAADATGGEELQ